MKFVDGLMIHSGDPVNDYVDMACRHVNVVIDWISRMNHQSINKLHSLSSLTSKLATDNNFATFCTTFHEKSKDTITCPSYSQASDKLVTEGFSLCNGA